MDALAPALLDARLGSREVNQMFSSDEENHYSKLRVAIERCLYELVYITDSSGELLDFANADLSGARGPWSFVNACYIASDSTPNVRVTKVSKILHRKQPTFIPIIDSRLASFYNLSKSQRSKYWSALQADYRANRDLLDQLGRGVLTSEGKPISSLRVADIVIWEHIVTGCDKAK